MSNLFSRTELLLGKEGMERLKNARVAVFGVGGVGSYCVEALARSGVGALDLIDNDKVAFSNINRQIIATVKTEGLYKVDAACERVKEINPDVVVRTYKTFYMPENADRFDFSLYDYVVDAIDTVTGKIEIIVNAQRANVPVISAMGAGNKVDPTLFRVADIYKTSVCPLAKVMRSELKKRGVKKCKVVYSTERPIFERKDATDIIEEEKAQTSRRAIPASIAFVPSVAGLIMAGEVIKDLAAVPFLRKGD